MCFCELGRENNISFHHKITDNACDFCQNQLKFGNRIQWDFIYFGRFSKDFEGIFTHSRIQLINFGNLVIDSNRLSVALSLLRQIEYFHHISQVSYTSLGLRPSQGTSPPGPPCLTDEINWIIGHSDAKGTRRFRLTY